MGDRGNIVIKQNSGASPNIWLYTHWEGYQIPGLVHKIIQTAKDKGRLNDEPYATRITVSVFSGEKVGDGAGYGVTTYPTDNEYDHVLVIDFESGLVQKSLFSNPETVITEWSMNEYLELAPKEWSDFK